MGDERNGGYQGRFCPDCKDRLSPDARRCACGWGAPKRREMAPETNNVCTWRSGNLTCSYPVARFDIGMKSGWCVFHRSETSGAKGARIADESQGHTPDEYLDRARLFVYGGGKTDNAVNAKLRARLRRVADGERVGILATRLLGDATPAGAADQHVAAADEAMLAEINRRLAEAQESEVV